jgi:hypothetical protein
MTRLQKCELLKEKGYTYNPKTGDILTPKKKIVKTNCGGYIRISNNRICLYGHHFAWYMTYSSVEFDELDHINRIRTDNRVSNLRMANRQLQCHNINSKGYTYDKARKLWKSQITIDNKHINLGRFHTEEEARNAYLEAKKKYHII